MKTRLMACTATLLSSFVFYCPYALAQCSLNIEGGINSGWNKENVSYRVEKNTLKINVGEGGRDDADSIYIGSIKGCSTLTINVSQISGKYPWGGKIIGFSFFNNRLEPHQWGNQASFPTPRGLAIEDGFVRVGSSNITKFIYDIPSSSEITYIGAKVFIGSNNAFEIQFAAQESSGEPQINAQQPSRSLKRYIDYTGHQPNSPAVSCSLNCHAPRTTEHRRSVFTRDFSIPPRAACREGSD